MKIHRHWSGEPHRIDGPAKIDDNGDSIWYMHGRRHRFGGPAIEYPSGSKEWWLNGVRYTEQNYHAQLKTLEQSP